MSRSDEFVGDIDQKYDLSMPFYHGSKVKERPLPGGLRVAKADPRSPFGPAIYTTQHLRVAKDQSGVRVVYEVRLKGDWDLAIQADKPLYKQTVGVKDRFTEWLNWAHPWGEKLVYDESHDTLEIVVSTIMERFHRDNPARLNRRFIETGIWSMFGVIHPMGYSGRCDKGVQFGILDDSKIELVRVVRVFDETRQDWIAVNEEL